MAIETERKCDGCDKPLGFIESQYWSVCMDCTKARARVATTGGRCKCGRKARQSNLHETHPGRDAGRKWYSCLRCLGSMEQVR